MKVLAILALVALAAATVIHKEEFDDAWRSRWVDTKASGKEYGEWKLTPGKWYGDEKLDQGLQTATDARFYASTTKFAAPFDNKDKDLVVQFSVKHEQKIDCGGGYLKILPADFDAENFNGESPYAIMFGPDICGPGTRKVHVIFNYKGENKLIKKEITAETDQLNHLYTLVVHPDQTYEVFVDQVSKQKGSLEEDWDFLEPKEINDPNESKPSEWVEEAMMDDAEDVKPEGYDDIPETIVDPEAEKPADWDDELDGDWEAPTIANPEFKGPFKAKKIANPEYKGAWVHPQVPNEAYVHDDSIYHSTIGGVAIDVWQVKAGSIFDNIFISDSLEEAEAHGKTHFKDLKDGEKKMWDDAETARREQEEEERKVREEERKKEEDAAKEKEGEEDKGEDWEEDAAKEEL